MWKTPVKHRNCALSFKVDNRATHAVAGMIGIFEGFDLRMFGQYLMYFFFEFALSETVNDPDLDLTLHHGIIERGVQCFQLIFDSVLIVFLTASELGTIDMEVYLLAKHRRIGLAATHGVSSTHHIAAQKISIYLL